MTDYVKRFNALVKDLNGHKYIEIVEYKTYAPARSAAFKALGAELGAPPAESIRDFYSQTNGLKLHWRIKPNLSPGETETLRKKSSDYYVVIAEYIDDPFANINLVSIEDVLGKRKTEKADAHSRETTRFEGTTYQRDQFLKMLRPFDLVNLESCMSFLVKKGTGNPPVLLLADRCSRWEGTRSTDFESYLEMLLVTRGIVEARPKILGADQTHGTGSLVGSETFWKNRYTPGMFAGRG